MINPNTIAPLIELQKLPENVVISTITITFTLGHQINTYNLAKYADITEHGFNKISYNYTSNTVNNDNDNTSIIRTFYPIVKKRTRNTNTNSKNGNTSVNEISNQIERAKMKSKSTKKDPEDNQCRIKIWTSVTQDCINVNVFNNGSVHFTGIKSSFMFEEIYMTLLNELNKKKFVVDLNNNLTFRPYIKGELSKDLFTNVVDFQICMINCTFDFYFSIKLDVLEIIMQELGIKARLAVDKHACVDIKYLAHNENTDLTDKEISIFVFESGKINITGSRNVDQVMCAYEYIEEILYDNFKKIVRINIEDIGLKIIRCYA